MNALQDSEKNVAGVLFVVLYKIELLKYLKSRKLLTHDISKYIDELKLTPFVVINDRRSFHEVYLNILKELELKESRDKK